MKIIIYDDEIYAYSEKNVEKVEQKIREKFNMHLENYRKIFTKCQTFVTSNLPCESTIVEFIGVYIWDGTTLEDLAARPIIGEYKDKYRIDRVKE